MSTQSSSSPALSDFILIPPFISEFSILFPASQIISTNHHTRYDGSLSFVFDEKLKTKATWHGNAEFSQVYVQGGVASEMFPHLKLTCWSLVFWFWFWLKHWRWLNTFSRIEHWRGKVTRWLRATAGSTKRFMESQPGWCWCCLKPAGDGSIFLFMLVTLEDTVETEVSSNHQSIL